MSKLMTHEIKPFFSKNLKKLSSLKTLSGPN